MVCRVQAVFNCSNTLKNLAKSVKEQLILIHLFLWYSLHFSLFFVTSKLCHGLPSYIRNFTAFNPLPVAKILHLTKSPQPPCYFSHIQKKCLLFSVQLILCGCTHITPLHISNFVLCVPSQVKPSLRKLQSTAKLPYVNLLAGHKFNTQKARRQVPFISLMAVTNKPYCFH